MRAWAPMSDLRALLAGASADERFRADRIAVYAVTAADALGQDLDVLRRLATSARLWALGAPTDLGTLAPLIEAASALDERVRADRDGAWQAFETWAQGRLDGRELAAFERAHALVQPLAETPRVSSDA